MTGTKSGGRLTANPYKSMSGVPSVANEIYQAASVAENAKDALRNARVKKSLLPKKYITFE